VTVLSRSAAALLLVLGTGVSAPTAAQQPSEAGRAVYEQARAFAAEGKIDQALSDYLDVVSRAPNTRLAGLAQLEVIRLQLEARNDAPQADVYTKQLFDNLAKFPGAEPQGLIFRGRIRLAADPSAVDAALDDFDRVPSRSPDADTLQMAGYFSIRALRVANRSEDALRRFSELAASYPRAIWTARARLEAALCHVRLGQPLDALAQLRRAGDNAADFTAAAQAELRQTSLAWSTQLYRLHVRTPAQPLYAGSQPALTSLTRVGSLAIAADGTLNLTSSERLFSFDKDGKPVTRFSRVTEASALASDADGRLLAGYRGVLAEEYRDMVTLDLPRPEKIVALGRLSNGQFIVGAQDGPNLLRFAGSENLGTFAPGRTTRIAVNLFDEVAVLRERTVDLYNRAGTLVGRIDAAGPGYELRRPVDLAYDKLGYLHVLDRTANALFVFGPRRQLVATFAGEARAPGSFRNAIAIALDGFGRLYVADDDTDSVVLYR
jgi:tetratricopeptide (TPR) repeat protein